MDYYGSNDVTCSAVYDDFIDDGEEHAADGGVVFAVQAGDHAVREDIYLVFCEEDAGVALRSFEDGLHLGLQICFLFFEDGELPDHGFAVTVFGYGVCDVGD